MLYERLLRPALFRAGHGDAERAHEMTLGALARVSARPAAVRALAALSRAAPATPVSVFGVDFPGLVGLAAGLDKDGRALVAWPALGFAFVEVGTVTAHAQAGNDKPRLFRLRDSEAVINRMGFNNSGAAALAIRLGTAGPLPVPLGISLGKSKATPIEDAVDDYLTSLRLLRGHGDYIAVNVSSPNTPGLRGLQDAAQLSALLAALRAEAEGKPLLIKIAPDLTDTAIGELLGVCGEHGVAGIIATNTTLSRDGLRGADVARAGEAGGLSGRPLRSRARDVVAFVARETGGKLPIIGVGGISDGDDAARMLDAGASLVQLYSALIFRGPTVLREINRRLRPGQRPGAAAPVPPR